MLTHYLFSHAPCLCVCTFVAAGKYNELNQSRFNGQFKRALLKGIADGVLLRTTAAADLKDLNGKVKLAPSKPKRATMREESVRRARKSKAQELKPEESQEVERGVQKKAARKNRKAPATKPSEPKPDTSEPIDESSQEPEPPKKPKARVPRRKPTTEPEPVEHQAEAGSSGKQRAQRSKKLR